MPRRKTYQYSQDGVHETPSPSRSQRKRDSTALQDMGEELTRLSGATLDAMPITPAIRSAVEDWHAMNSHEAKRRQLQYIGRLMREEADADEIRIALQTLRDRATDETFRFRYVEDRREELINANPDDRQRLCNSWGIPAARIGEILKLTEDACNEREHNRPPRSFRALFRLLRALDTEQKN